jgi:signal transduction histidine kinase
MKRLSLRDRVTLASTAVLAIALIVASLVGNLLLSNRLQADAGNVLRNRADAQLVSLEKVNGVVKVRESSNDQALDEQSWIYANGKTIVQARAGASVEAAAKALANVDHTTYVTVPDRARLLAKPAYGADGKERIGTVVVGLSLNAYEHTERLARIGTLLLDFFVLLAGALTVRWAVGRALKPVETMTERASEWSEHDLHRRFEMGEPYDEITGLATTLDTLLGRIDAAMRREQRVTAEIAHELRTPLTSVRAEAELALRSESTDNSAALKQIIASTDRMNASIETLLAAHVGDTPAGRSCDPVVAVNEAVDAVHSLASEAAIELTVHGRVGADRVDTDAKVLAQTLAPLLENAVRHAQSKASVDVSRVGTQVVVNVTDDGNGVAPDAHTSIFKPGVSESGGAGLGLPLARRLAQTYGAELTAPASGAGGHFELRIPGSAAS